MLLRKKGRRSRAQRTLGGGVVGRRPPSPVDGFARSPGEKEGIPAGRRGVSVIPGGVFRTRCFLFSRVPNCRFAIVWRASPGMEHYHSARDFFFHARFLLSNISLDVVRPSPPHAVSFSSVVWVLV